MGNFASKSEMQSKFDELGTSVKAAQDDLKAAQDASKNAVPVGSVDINFSKKLNVVGTFTASGDTILNGGLKVPSTALVQFGNDVPVGTASGEREAHAGQIGYNIHGGTAVRPHLAVVGGGKGGQSRKVKLWDELQVNGSVSMGTNGEDGNYYLVPGVTDNWLRLFDRTGNHSAGFAAQNLWTKQILSDPRVSIPNGVEIGSWAMYPNGGQLCFQKIGVGDVMCLHDGQDKVQFYRNNDHNAPYWYYNAQGGWGEHRG